MPQLPDRLKRGLSRAARGERRRPVLQGLHHAAVAAETAAARVAASGRRVEPVDPGNVTLAIKTFERPEVLRRMLGSVRAVYSGPIVVADDSAEAFVAEDPGVRVLRLPFDSGVGAGRNAVTTEYLWMADDDMILLPDFDIARVVAYLERNPEVDLCGGRVVNLPQMTSADYLTSGLFAYEGEPRRPRGSLIDGLPVSDKVPNFYVARTAALREVRYDDRLKRVDHTDFFTTAYGRLLCVYDAAMVCLHAHSYFDPHYLAFRQDTAADLAHLGQKWGGRGVVAAEGVEGVELDARQRAVFHRAALQVVADDLGVGVALAEDGDVVSVAVADAERPRLVEGLVALGWRGSGRRLVSPVWGEVSVRGGAVPASAPSTPPVAVAGGPGRVRWSDRAAWVDAGEVLLVAALPLGPVYTLAPPGDVIWEVVGPDGAEVDAVVAEVVSAFEDVPEGAERQIREHLDVLVARGLMVRG